MEGYERRVGLNWFSRGLRWLLEHSRPALHPAVTATWQFVVYFMLISAIGTPLVSVINHLGEERFEIAYALQAMFGGLLIIGEFARGIAKAALGKRPDEWSFAAVAVGGATAGAAFQGYLALTWGYERLSDFGVTMAIGAALWLSIGGCLFWEERRNGRAAAKAE